MLSHDEQDEWAQRQLDETIAEVKRLKAENERLRAIVESAASVCAEDDVAGLLACYVKGEELMGKLAQEMPCIIEKS
jgi:hypothetical protein